MKDKGLKVYFKKKKILFTCLLFFFYEFIIYNYFYLLLAFFLTYMYIKYKTKILKDMIFSCFIFMLKKDSFNGVTFIVWSQIFNDRWIIVLEITWVLYFYVSHITRNKIFNVGFKIHSTTVLKLSLKSLLWKVNTFHDSYATVLVW